ncbi:Cupin domain protein [Verrucomicrobiia bacterium DG1235]|nr:Cupin domain protein [Verrucomicrobiae bacterium DG1235]
MGGRGLLRHNWRDLVEVAFLRFCGKALTMLLLLARKTVVVVAIVLALNVIVSAQNEVKLLGSTVFDWEALVPVGTEVGERRDFVDSPTATLKRFECHATTLDPGLDSHPQHQHAQEEFIILKEGLLDVIINGEATRAGPGSLFFYAANDFHSVRNVGEEPATYLVFSYATKETQFAPDEPAAKSALASAVYDWEKLAVETTKKGARRELFDSMTVTAERLRCHVTSLHAGLVSHAAHRHPDEEIIVVKEGLLEATVEGKSETAGPGSVFFFASGELHGLRNAGETEATYYVIRIVTRDTPTESSF